MLARQRRGEEHKPGSMIVLLATVHNWPPAPMLLAHAQLTYGDAHNCWTYKQNLSSDTVHKEIPYPDEGKHLGRPNAALAHPKNFCLKRSAKQRKQQFQERDSRHPTRKVYIGPDLQPGGSRPGDRSCRQ